MLSKNSKEMLQRKACNDYQNRSEKEKDKKCQFVVERYKDLSK